MDFDNSLDIITPDVPSQTITIGGTGSLKIPAGTTGQQPTGSIGMIRYNSSNNLLEGYINTAWASLQLQSTNLDGLSSLSTTGLMTKTGTGTYTSRTITAPPAGISITNGDGVAGNPTLALGNDIGAIEALSGTGIAVRTAADTWAQRSITVSSPSRLTITNGDGVSGNPTLDLASSVIASPGTYSALTVDTYGRVTAGSNTLATALNEAPTATLASASASSVASTAANTINITGTTAITALGTIAAGAIRRLWFAASLTLTHNATSLILPTGANITTAANDVADFISLGSGNWFCYRYSRASGASIGPAPRAITVASPIAADSFTMFFTAVAMPLSQIRSLVSGSSTPSVTFSIKYGSSRASGTEMVTSGITCTNTTTGLSTTSFTNGTIPANNFVWIDVTAVSGSVSEIHVSLLT